MVNASETLATQLGRDCRETREGETKMALAIEVDATAHAALPEAVRGLYVAGDGGKYRLDVSGLEDTSGLKTALQKERDAVKLAKQQHAEAMAAALKPYEGIDPVKTRALLAQFEDADEAALIAQGKDGIEKVIARRMEKHTAAQQKLIDKAIEEKEGALEVAQAFMDRVLDNNIRAAATKAGIHPGAVDDALLRARLVFSIDDDGNAVQFDDDGETIVLGKDGKTPFSPDEWFEGMKESAPHWFPASSSGGGATGSRGGAGGGKTMKRAAFDALDPVAKAAAIREKINIVD
jgi:hypothetical protein